MGAFNVLKVAKVILLIYNLFLISILSSLTYALQTQVNITQKNLILLVL